MITQYTLLTPAIAPAIETGIVKDYLKVPSSLNVDDGMIMGMIGAATAYFEKATGRDLINKTYKCYLDKFPSSNSIYYYSGVSSLCPKYNDNGIKIRKSKLQSITDIKYYANGVITTLPPEDYYITDLPDYSSIYLVNGKIFPEVDLRKQSVAITFIAGFGNDSCDIPVDIQNALLQMITYMYENRGDCANKEDMMASTQLFDQYKIIDF